MAGHVYGGDDPEPICAEAILDAKQLLGDASGALHTIIMHSAAYTQLQKNDLIANIMPSQSGAFSTYLGYNVIVDDFVQYDENDGLYSAYLLADGVIGRGDGNPVDFTHTEAFRDGLRGEDILIHRKALILHPMGVKYIGAVGEDVSPTNAELANPANWARVSSRKNVRMIEIKHTL
jgi:hypothetical protein